jgi:hypothetical protein
VNAARPAFCLRAYRALLLFPPARFKKAPKKRAPIFGPLQPLSFSINQLSPFFGHMKAF